MAWIDPTTPAGVQPVGFSSGFTLVFSDEFNSSTLDATKWKNYHDFADKTASSAWDINAGGNSALRMWWNGNTATDNQMMVSNGSTPFRKRFGYYEARMKCASGKGWFPGFWLYPFSDAGAENPDGSQHEIDIVEWFAYENGDWLVDTTNYRAKNAKFTVWTEGGGGATNQAGAIKMSDITGYNTTLSTGYHTYGLHWTAAGGLKWYLDGVLMGTIADPWGASNTVQLCVILQLWWGSNGGIPVPVAGSTPTTASDTTSMLFDYVRVWDIGVTQPPVGPTWKIMPLGDSITEGDSATANYRDRLADLLLANSISAGFYGSMVTNTSALPAGFQEHEGHSSWCSTDAGSVAAGPNFFVSPSGSDSNNGTSQATPWKTIGHAVAAVVTPGSTIWLMDGVYPQSTVQFNNSGTQAAPITLRAVNKWQARISSTSGCNPTIGVLASWITLRDIQFDINAANATCQQYTSSNVDVRGWNGNIPHPGNESSTYEGLRIVGCKTTGNGTQRAGAFKSNQNYTIIEDCDVNCQIETLNTKNSIMRRNIVRGTDQWGGSILCKGGDRNTRIYNNLILNSSTYGAAYAISIGGDTINTSTYDPATNYEAYNVCVYNNVIIDQSGVNRLLIQFWGARDCAFINNTCVGVAFNCRPSITNVARSGNPTIKNNVLYGTPQSWNYGNPSAPGGVWSYDGVATIDYNNFYLYSAVPAQAHPITGNPTFVNLASDWHLQATSPDINAGTASTFIDFNGNAVDLTTDYDGAPRTSPYSVGAYEYGGVIPPAVTPNEAICQFGNTAYDPSRPIGILENITAWLGTNPSNMVLLLIGLNDGSNSAVQTAVSGIIDKILAANSATKILVSTLRTYGNPQTNRNNAIIAACSGKTNTTVIDAYAGWVDATDFVSSTSDHPTQAGYNKMADNWFAAIQNAIGPGAVFNAAVSQAPANNATISGVVTLEVAGDLIENCELLPPTGYTPIYATFTINPAKTVATASFNTNLLPNGPLNVRIAAYDQPAGSPNPTTEITAMSLRTWTINNLPATVMPVCTVFDIG